MEIEDDTLGKIMGQKLPDGEAIIIHLRSTIFLDNILRQTSVIFLPISVTFPQILSKNVNFGPVINYST